MYLPLIDLLTHLPDQGRPYPVLALNITLGNNFIGKLSLNFLSLHRFYLFHLLTVLSVIIHLRPNLSELSMQGFAVSPSRCSVFLFLDALASLDLKLSLSQSFTFFTASASTGLSDFFYFFFVQKTRDIGVEFGISQKLLPQSQPNMAYTWYHLLPYQAP